MNRDKASQRNIAISIGLGGLLLLGAFLCLSSGLLGTSSTAYALPAELTPTPHPGPAFVKQGGTGLGCTQSDPCGSIQYAIDYSYPGYGDVIYIAGGTYTGTGPSVITITRSVTLYGGWDGAPTGPIVRDPKTYTTTLDGEGQRRVVYIYGNITATLDGLVIARGNASNDPAFPGEGGGILSRDATPIIVNCLITGNVAYSTTTVSSGLGGGVRIVAPRGTAVISGNRVISNAASLRSIGLGGGIYLLGAPGAQVVNNVILGNTAAVSATVGYGGGIAVEGTSENALLQGNEVKYNVAVRHGNGAQSTRAYGGGIYVGSHSVVVSDNVVLSNTAIITGGSGNGGGIAVMGSDDVVRSGNRVEYNIAQQDTVDIPSNHGGGIYCFFGNNAVIRGNVIRHNTASVPYTGGGGGVYLSSCDQATFTDNTVEDNFASHNGNGYGGGFHAYASQGLRLDANTFLSNTASLALWGRGGGLYFSRKTVFTMTNNIVAANYARREGGGVAFETDVRLPVTGTLVHNTFAANDRGEGDGRIAIHLNDPYVTLVLTNNLIYSHTYGVYATAGSTVILYNTLLYADSVADVGGAGTITNTDPITGQDPLLDADYHLQGGSPAVDAGVLVPWVTTDIDGNPRPLGPLPDVGADEAWRWVYLPLVLRDFP